MSSDDAGLTADGRRRRRSPSLVSETVSPLENEDTVSEIFLHLSPAPSSLPRASVVCKRWRRLITDPCFLRRFRARHRHNAPLLGFFAKFMYEFVFNPTLDPPDGISPGYFSLQLDNASPWGILCCRHGLVLLHFHTRRQLLVWDPVTGDQHHFAVPPEFHSNKDMLVLNGAVLRAAGDFKVVLLGKDASFSRPYAWAYSSDTGEWGDSTACPSSFFCYVIPSTLVAGSLYWVLVSYSPGVRALEYDLDRQCLSVIEMPLEVPNECSKQIRIMRAEGGVLGFVFLSPSSFNIQLWKRNTDCDGGAGWVLGRTIELRTLLPLGSDEGLSETMCICGFVEDENVLLIRTRAGALMIQLDSMQSNGMCSSRLIPDTADVGIFNNLYHPFTSVAGMLNGGRQDGAELLQNA